MSPRLSSAMPLPSPALASVFHFLGLSVPVSCCALTDVFLTSGAFQTPSQPNAAESAPFVGRPPLNALLSFLFCFTEAASSSR